MVVIVIAGFMTNGHQWTTHVYLQEFNAPFGCQVRSPSCNPHTGSEINNEFVYRH